MWCCVAQIFLFRNEVLPLTDAGRVKDWQFEAETHSMDDPCLKRPIHPRSCPFSIGSMHPMTGQSLPHLPENLNNSIEQSHLSEFFTDSAKAFSNNKQANFCQIFFPHLPMSIVSWEHSPINFYMQISISECFLESQSMTVGTRNDLKRRPLGKWDFGAAGNLAMRTQPLTVVIGALVASGMVVQQLLKLS